MASAYCKAAKEMFPIVKSVMLQPGAMKVHNFFTNFSNFSNFFPNFRENEPSSPAVAQDSVVKWRGRWPHWTPTFVLLVVARMYAFCVISMYGVLYAGSPSYRRRDRQGDGQDGKGDSVGRAQGRECESCG